MVTNTDRNPIELKQLNDHIWLMNDNNQGTGFIVVGSEKAAVIDTMNGFENVEAIVRRVTELPLVVINTHGHPDHIFGNVYFEEAYIHPDDLELANRCLQIPMFADACKKYGLTPAKFLMVNAGDIFDLGGITLETYLVPGHTHGGICLLDIEDRILFTGDTINRHTWMQLEDSLPLTDTYESLGSLKKIRDRFDYILHGHALDFEPASLYEEHRETIKEVADGVNDNDTSYTWSGGTDMQHPFKSGNGIVVYRK